MMSWLLLAIFSSRCRFALSATIFALAIPEASFAGSTACRPMQAMCVAHWEAVVACLERLPQDPWTQQDGTLFVSLAALMENGPLALALDPKLHSLFAQLWRHVRQASLWMRQGGKPASARKCFPWGLGCVSSPMCWIGTLF